MDPNEALRLIRRLVSDSEEIDEYYDYSVTDRYDDLEEAVKILDTWLSSGGFLPDDWNKNREAE